MRRLSVGMSRGRHATPVKLVKKERNCYHSSPGRPAAHRDVMRARIASCVHEGHSNTVIAQELGVSVQTISALRGKVRRACVRVSTGAHASHRKRNCS
ncbi:helix-turn-helix domain-containing protein [Paraburkholderia humisilvae]|uniref:helix-turn-helix domain-containing protein n=1 Tax=Paraburkholderia humisilvae TaxID=627669 RepID=UPI00360700CF